MFLHNSKSKNSKLALLAGSDRASNLKPVRTIGVYVRRINEQRYGTEEPIYDSLFYSSTHALSNIDGKCPKWQ